MSLADREEYERLIKDYPPVADISFVSMFTWWDAIGSADVSVLNGNLVISYWIPGDEIHSGLSLIGTNQAEESICEIFDYLRSRGERPHLVNVPEFVVHSLRYPELFRFISQRSDDEYIIPLSGLSSLKNLPTHNRAKIKRFMRELGPREAIVKSVNLSSGKNKDLFLIGNSEWPIVGFNDLGSIERNVLHSVIESSEKLGEENICLFIDGELQAYCLYHTPHDPRYIIIDHARINYGIPGIFDYIALAFSQYMQKRKAAFVNVHADMGFARLRVFKLALRPSNFFRKYTIEPAGLTKG